ncbi:MAG: molybdenum cofactor guanylyltransferase [Deltaproteobacteria bacterium]|nr:molybdenum cofactor guanylyltransferase [Deltaproteobacteria bacterium]
MTALILAGGKATRLGGIAKHAIVIEGSSILARQRAVLEPRVGALLVSSRQAIEGVTTVVDTIIDGGPLAGVAAGLAAAGTPWLLVVAGDMPHLAPAVVELLLARTRAEVDAVGIQIAGLPEPLLCVLRVAAVRPVLEARLAAGRFKASGLLADPALRVVWLDEAELRAVDPTLKGLFNVNEPRDL